MEPIPNVTQEIYVPPEAKSIVTACRDLNQAASESDTKYLIIGSVASVCAAGQMYRVPGDVDAWYDIYKAAELRASLQRQGYSYRVIEANGSPFPYPLEHFEKGKSTIELRGAQFTEKGIEYPIRIPIRGLPLDRRPLAKLVYPKSFALPQTTNFGGAIIQTASKEALWIGLNTTLPFIQLVGEKVSKRLLDMQKLTDGLDSEKVKVLIAEKPGLYYKGHPLITAESEELLRLLSIGVRLSNYFKSR